jgi:uncharacterized protein (TIGR03000 family)
MEIATVNCLQPAASIDSQVPDEHAPMWLDGQPTQQRGTFRPFATPPLEPGRTYSYQLHARWL